MSHYSFRHGKSHSTASSSPSSGNHQRVTYGSRSTSTGTPPQTPTIRVTSPVPDAVGVIDIWDPEVTDDEPQASIPKSYSFRYNEEEKKQQQQQNEGKSSSTAESPPGDRKKKVYTDSGMQADSSQQQQTSQDASTAAKIPTSSLSNHHLNDDDGLKSSESAEESSDCEEMSQISAVTQVLRCSSPNETEGDPVDDKNHSSETVIEPESVLPSDDPKEPHPDSDSMPPIDKPVKRVQFSRSLSLVPGSNASQSAVNELMTDGQRAGTRSGAGRRYSSLDSTTCSAVPFDILPSSTFTFVDQLPASGGKMLSPTPESALENAQSPQQEEDQIIILEQIVDQNVQQSATPANVTSTTLSVTVEQVGNEEEDQHPLDHDPTCDLFDRLNSLKNDEELMDLATGFVLQLLRTAQEEALRRGHVPSKMEQKSKMSLELQHVAVPKGRNHRKWYSRLRMLLLRTLTCTCVPTHPNIQSPLSN